jgi:hypothetical protein
MTAHKDFKNIIRQRQQKTGESYTAARAHVLRKRNQLLGLAEDTPLDAKALQVTVEAVVLKINSQSIRVDIPAEGQQVTFRTGDLRDVIPGQVATLAISKRWTWRDTPYASGKIRDARTDIPRIGLTPLPLSGGDLTDLRRAYEPFQDPDPYAPFWRALTAHPRKSYVMDPIAWGALPGVDLETNATYEAARLADGGEVDKAYQVLMDLLCRDLRCIDAHAHLGNLEFDNWPQRAMLHYEIGIKIGELSLPPEFDGVLPWGHIYNRPFLRCLKGYALCLWRTGEAFKAQEVFERILSLNPNDNQGVRFLWHDVQQGMSWEDSRNREAEQRWAN